MPNLSDSTAVRGQRLLALAVALSLGFVAFAAADEARITEVSLEPSETLLMDADQSVQFLVTLKMSDGTLRDGTRQAKFSAKLPEGAPADTVAAIEQGRLTPKADGDVTVSATVLDPVSKQPLAATAKVGIKGF